MYGGGGMMGGPPQQGPPGYGPPGGGFPGGPGGQMGGPPPSGMMGGPPPSGMMGGQMGGPMGGMGMPPQGGMMGGMGPPQSYGGPPGGMGGPCGGGPCGGQQMGAYSAPAEACDVFVEISPEVQPTFNRGQNGTFIMCLPPLRVRLQTSCQPPPPQDPGLTPFRPYEEFQVHFPEVSQVVFDPARQQPPNASAAAQTFKRGAVLEVPPRVTLNAQVKANSPYGSLVLEDFEMDQYSGQKRKIGETTLMYKLQVEGQPTVNKNGGNMGANRLEVDLNLTFSCQLVLGGGGPGGPPPSMMGGGPGGPPPMMGGPGGPGGPPSMMGGPPGAGPCYGGGPPGGGFGGPPGGGGMGPPGGGGFW